MRSTIGEARKQFDQEIAPRATEHWLKKGRQILDAAEQRAKQFAEGYVERRESEALALRDSALRELTDVRDSLDSLVSSASEGRIEAAQYADVLAKLRGRQTAAEAQLDKADKVAHDIASVEADPIAWFDELSRRIPTLKPWFPW